MQHKRLVSALKKFGFNPTIAQDSNEMYIVEGSEYTLTWYVQNEEANCVHLVHKSLQSDSMSDYFPGRFVDTIKGAVAGVSRTKSVA